ncbi:acetaldehyde dehydrogenase (acetylating) [Fictibacillus fluitans]|uniref:Acetaldehyde dehydrogenase (Acetylating) n=1 Tax=Fictibacillus fluitans TaxID=3058422 RepID=A0ABT8I0T1_9BACL|nr:acetaldehyde dehydrogenase (acetylating) [Fictibacillus sp. NE201]MDN4526633.1 acetaldehyde dehydrogenase (acetylating) [Fictibacillus sp. NE201]
MNVDLDLLSMQEMRNAVENAKKAQRKFSKFTQEQVDRVIDAIAETAYKESLHLAELAVKETGLGVIEHKKIKNELGSKGVYESIKDIKTVGMINEDKQQKIVEIAAPFGVVAGIVPVTNPTSTTIFKTLISLKAGNGIVFSPHPSGKKCTVEAAKICMKAAEQAGAPEGLIGWITEPSMEATQALMKHRDVNVILATGGGGLVRAAYSSGKPAYGVGPGNVPVYIEKSAEVKKAVKRIMDSKTFDYGTICASEQSVIADQNVKELAVREFKNQGAYFLNSDEKRKMEKIISPQPGKLNPKIVGKSPVFIAEMAGLEVPADTTLLIAFESEIGKDIPFSIEKLAPIFAFYTVKDSKEALTHADKLLKLGGRGHSLSIHTTDEDVAKAFALEMPVSRVLVNTPSALGAVGGTTGLKPSMTLGCGTFGGNITSDNVTVTHLFNKKRLAYGTKEIVVTNKEQKEDYKTEKNGTNNEQLNMIVNEVLSKVNGSKDLNKETIQALVSQAISKL